MCISNAPKVYEAWYSKKNFYTGIIINQMWSFLRGSYFFPTVIFA